MARGRTGSRLVIQMAALLAATSPWAQPSPDPPPVSVIGCESLVALRQLTAGATSSGDAAAHLSAHPGCRSIPRAMLGEVGQRAMIGGAPFECMTVRESPACAWIAP